VHGKGDGEPDRGGVADGRQVFVEAVEDEAPGVRQVLDSAFQRVEVEIARQRPFLSTLTDLCLPMHHSRDASLTCANRK